ncbi:MAG TPA: fumarylacetoacetate hydrolase family protein [Bryobacteraceae bacterium]|nr:fumarylacetoacetate hydrolase family protein [Bryobacteraceae bacterium]
MKLATFEVPTSVGPVRRIGAAVGDRVVDFSAAFAAHLEKTDPACDARKMSALYFPADMVSYLETGAMGRRAAEQAIEAAAGRDEAFGARTSYALREIRLMAPITRPRVMRDFLTFEGHMQNAARVLGWGAVPPVWYQIPSYYKGIPDTVIGTGETVTIPPYCENFDFELELGMVIGRNGRNIAREDAGKYIAGYTIWNDFSARDQQKREGPLGMGPSKGKDFDSGNAVGPYLVTADEFDPSNARMIARVNGEVWTDSWSTGRQFSFEDLIAYVSRGETIHTGELWGSGTVTGGSGLEIGKWLKPGDLIELEIEGIGVLANNIVGS